MQLYNSLSRKKEDFTPVNENRVNMYVCGITAYDYCHIGHARSALVFDVLVRYLNHLGLDVNFVRNFTDVDDKIIARANKEGKDCREIAEKYMQAFHEDMDRLGVRRAGKEPKATEHIPQIIQICEKLISQNKAYATPGGDVYFRVRAFPTYGQLSGRTIDDLISGARVAPGEEKKDPMDFALWKAAKPGEPFWESPWGKGRPGWHIECSAMSEPYLPLDIHGGGLDLIFPHHENEIAQSEAATGKKLANFWVHNGFVQVNSEKMSKSLGNFKTIREIIEHYLPEVLRFFLLSKHYRSPIDFSYSSMEESERALKRVYECLLEAKKALQRTKWKNTSIPDSITNELQKLSDSFYSSLDDDLNTASAIGHIFAMVRIINSVLEDKNLRASEKTKQLLADFLKTFQKSAQLLGVFCEDASKFLNDLRLSQIKRRNIDTAQIDSLIEERTQARKNKDFARSDEIRDTLQSMGILLRDTPEGTVWDIA